MRTSRPPLWAEDGPLAPWNRQPGWQVAVGTRTPRIFRMRQALARLLSAID